MPDDLDRIADQPSPPAETSEEDQFAAEFESLDLTQAEEKPTVEPEASPPAEKAKKKPEAKAETKPEEKAKEPAEPEEPTDPDEWLAQKADQLDELIQKETQKQQEEETKKAAPPETPSEAARTLTENQVRALLDAIPKDELPGRVALDDETDLNMAQFIEDFPEQYAANKVVTGLMVKKILEGAVRTGVLTNRKTVEGLQKQLQSLGTIVQRQGFWLDLAADGHPDARQIVKTDDWKAWIETLPEKKKRLINAQDAGIASKILTVYKRHMEAKKKASKHDEGKGAEKKVVDDLYGESLGSESRRERGPSAKNQEDEYDRYFDTLEIKPG